MNALSVRTASLIQITRDFVCKHLTVISKTVVLGWLLAVVDLLFAPPGAGHQEAVQSIKLLCHLNPQT